ncbi:MAG: type 4a pilus biogenesis protein PilO [Candidatus Gribaldobacteria bacterium]|nr:type 4a pilus biogenesis protein PilO [Candidatus Gribaldobacteria bacterium]
MKKAIFLPILSFLIFVVILYGLAPLLSKTQSLASALEKQTIALQEIKDYFVNLQIVADQLDQNPGILANVAEALPTEFFLPSLMGFFQTTAAESGLLLRDFNYNEMGSATTQTESVSTSTSTIASFIKTTAFNLTLNGNIASFENFLKNLETSSRILDVGRINFQASSEAKVLVGQNKNNGNDFIISVKTYSY